MLTTPIVYPSTQMYSYCRSLVDTVSYNSCDWQQGTFPHANKQNVTTVDYLCFLYISFAHEKICITNQ